MTGDSEARAEMGQEKPSSPPNLVREQIQPCQAEAAEGLIDTAITGRDKGGFEPEKAAHTQKEGHSDTAASKTAPKPPDSTANANSNDLFGEEDNEYISGYKLYAALFGIVSVFFLVLLDFSITATVSARSF